MDNLIQDLINKNIFKIDDKIKFNLDLIGSYPYITNILIKFIFEKIKSLEYTNLIGVSPTGKHIVSILSNNYNIPILFLNKKNVIETEYSDSNKVILFVDKLDTGQSLLKILSILKANKINVNYIFTLYDTNNAKVTNFNIISIFNRNYLYKLLQKKNLINPLFNLKIKSKLNRLKQIKKSKLGLCSNQTDIKDIIREVDNVSNKIVLLKVCSNKIENYSKNYGSALRKLADNYKFLIINDLGIYDLKHINLDDYKWCDMISTYNLNLKSEKNIDLVYISLDKTTNLNNNSIIGSIGQVNNNLGFTTTNSINSIEKLKGIKIKEYDVVMIDDKIINDNIIQYINQSI